MAIMHKRRNYFIDKKFQTNFILKFCIITIISSLLIGGLIMYLSQDTTTVAIENTKVTVKSTSDFILPVAAQTILIVILFTSLAVIALTLLISHKISGPLYRLTNEINAVAGGDLRRNFNTRSNDQLKNLSQGLLDMCSALQGGFSEIKDSYKKLQISLKSKNLSPQEKEEIASILAEVEKKLERFKT
jgi:methyl-accepting chemotaxis protein